jgi:hypothetical protein
MTLILSLLCHGRLYPTRTYRIHYDADYEKKKKKNNNFECCYRVLAENNSKQIYYTYLYAILNAFSQYNRFENRI